MGSVSASVPIMSLFDFFFPEQAQAMHLRSLAAQNSQEAMGLRREQMSAQRQEQRNRILIGTAEEQIEKLEGELAQSCLVIEGLIELLEESGVCTREALQERVAAIDVRDGVADGRSTLVDQVPAKKEPFEPNRDWPGD